MKSAEYVGFVGCELDKGDRTFILGTRSSEITKGDRTPYNDRSVWYLVLRAIEGVVLA